jgi:CBS domain-containing protein
MTTKMGDIMSPAPVCMAPGESVSAAARAMKQHGIGTVLVLTDGELTGLVTDRDITVRVLAARLVRERAVRRIPVLRDGTPVGVVSIGDLALEKDATSALSGVSAAPPNS